MTNDTQVRNASGTIINPAVQEQQFQQSTHWQIQLSGAGTIQAEASGKVVVLTDVYLTATANTGFNIREKDASGTILFTARAAAYADTSHSFRQGIEGAAYDGSNAGDLYLADPGATFTATFTGYLRDA